MGTLVFIRHGQARTFEQDSDRLSSLGEQQAAILGQFWAQQGVAFDEVYSGALVRQRNTAEIVGRPFTDWPSIQITSELNEYDSVGITARLIPALAERDASFRELLATYEANKTAPDRNRYFQKMFEFVIGVWLDGTLEIEGVESWSTFSSRVRNALRRIVSAEGSGRRVAVFTSGGVIGLAVQTVLAAPDRAALDLNWRVRNCSLTEFTFSRHRLSLDSFNTIPHLADPSLRTYR